MSDGTTEAQRAQRELAQYKQGSHRTRRKPYTEERLAGLAIVFAPLAEALLQEAEKLGYNVQIAQGRRTLEEQAVLYAQGRERPGPIVTNAKPGQSAHNYGMAVDLFFLDAKGKAVWTEGLYAQLWKACVVAGLDKEGLSWAGMWTGKLRESAHFELADWKKRTNKGSKA